MIMLPSVTRILSPWSDFSMISEEVLNRASLRGTRVHQACAAYAMDFPMPDDIEEDDCGYIDSFKNWFDDTVDGLASVEHEYINRKYGFMGHPDLVCYIKGEICVVDLKTPRTTSPSWKLQLAAYAHLTQAQRCFSLRLNPDGGRAIVDEVKDWQRDLAIFFNALSVWRYYHG
jgi:hypothetical protein